MRRLTVEALVIVASILVAFGIDAWWGERQEVQAAEELARNLLEDVRASQQDLQRIRLLAVRKRDAALLTRELLRSPTPVVSADSLMSLMVTAGAIDVTWPVLRSYEQLVSTGLLRKLQPEVRAGIAQWVLTLEDTGRYGEQEQLEFRRTVWFPFWAEGGVAFDEMLQGYGGLDFGNPRFPRSWRDLHESRELNGLLATTAVITQSLVANYDDVDSAAAELASLLVSHYGDE